MSDHLLWLTHGVDCGNSEEALLSVLLGKISTLDPDIILGHDLHGMSLEVLLERMKKCRIGAWSKLGRLQRKEYEPIITRHLPY
jgi:DNA polymerase alpha subunit A